MTTGEKRPEQLVELLGAQAKRLAAEVPSGLRRVTVRAGDATVEMEWGASVGVASPPAAAEVPAQQNGAAPAQQNGAAPAQANAVVAPLVGTFYHAPEPGSPPFVQVGDVVAADTVVGIVEAMKMMNKVRAGRSGTVAAVLVADGELVEYGQPLVELTAGV